MATNADGTVTTKTTGKVAQSPSGSGTGKVTPVAAKSSTAAPYVSKQPGRTAVGRSARAR